MGKKVFIFLAALIFFTCLYFSYFPKNSNQLLLKSTLVTEDNKTIAKSIVLYKLKVYKKIIDENFINILKNNNINPHKRTETKYFYFYKTLLNTQQVDKLKKQLIKYQKRVLLNFHLYSTISFDKYKEKRVYPYNELFTPIQGYTRVIEKVPYQILKGVYGLEGADNSRDNIVKTTLNLKLQEKVYQLLKKIKKKKNLYDVVGILINKNTGEILADAHYLTYNPNNFRKKDIIKAKIIELRYLFPIKGFLKFSDINLSKYHFQRPTTELLYERKKDNYFNFLELIKFLIPFYNGGYIVNPHFFKKTKIDRVKFIDFRYYPFKKNVSNFYLYSDINFYFDDINKTIEFDRKVYGDNILFLMYIYNYKRGYFKKGKAEIIPK